jgi:hypothetical protein
MYTTIDQIGKAFFDLMENCPISDPLERKLWLDSQPEGKILTDLWGIYFDAERNAPDELVGVGRITYAENAMIAYQRGLKK